jgi:hypothetical protein
MTRAARTFLVLAILLTLAGGTINGQRLALIDPEKDAQSKFAAALIEAMPESVEVVDAELATAAFHGSRVENPFNMTAGESKNVGAAIGCDFFIVFSSAVQRRSVVRGNDYHEAYAVIRLVSSRTGRLVYFEIVKAEQIDPDQAARVLISEARALAPRIEGAMQTAKKMEASESVPPPIANAPESGSEAAKAFQLPVPFRRIKPEYVTTAALYSVAATVEILVDLDSAGTITRTEITRWAGFGLDESVEKAVRAMNWRPAYRDGRPLPMRVLLRYNFKRLEAAK